MHVELRLRYWSGCCLGVCLWLPWTSVSGESIELQSNGVPNGSIVVTDADRSDWDSLEITPYALDPIGDAGPEIDYVAVFVANDEDNVYFRFGLSDSTPETPEPFGFRHNVYLDTDRNRDTGFYGSGSFLAVGADYLLQGATLYQFAGADAETWGWAEVVTSDWDDTTPTDIETLLPLDAIGDTPEFDFFLNGANSDFASEDFVPDFANAGNLGDYFTYELGFVGNPNLVGDFDGDQDYSCADVDDLVREIIQGTNASEFDLNSDNTVDEGDLSQWLAIAGSHELASGNAYLPTDANLDGVVNAQDLNSVGVHWQSSPNAWCSGDFTADGVVDAADLNLLGINWQRSAEAVMSPIPEPRLRRMLFVVLAAILRMMRGGRSRKYRVIR